MEVTSGDVRAAIRGFVVENFFVTEPAALADDDSLVDHGIVDSTGVLELVAFLERRFGLRVEDVDLVPENLESIARMADFVARKVSAQRPPADEGRAA
jgi:acyl carrier protein